ncbi:MAG: hypothetical protein ACI9MC_003914 [Kiritimatiellia bacterium]|jgi:hypothetical protein
MVPPPFRLDHQQLASAAHGSDRVWRAALRDQQLHHLDHQQAIPNPLRTLSKDARQRSRLQRVDRVTWLTLSASIAAIGLLAVMWWALIPSWPVMVILLVLTGSACGTGAIGIFRGATQLREDHSQRRMATLRELWLRDVVISDGHRVVQSVSLTVWALQVHATLRDLKTAVPSVKITRLSQNDMIELTAAIDALQQALDEGCPQLEIELKRLTLQVGAARRPDTRALRTAFPTILCLWAEVERLRQQLDPSGRHLPTLPRPVGASHPTPTAKTLRPITLQ